MTNGHTGTRAHGHEEPDGGSFFRRQMLWLKAQTFAENIAELVVRLPRDRAADPIASQLVRSAGSVSANIAEGYGRYSQPAYRNHLSIARGSTFESESWLDLLIRRGYVSDTDGKKLLDSCHELGRLLTLRMKSLDENKTYAVKEDGIDYEV
jgi:four helix bundle protein